MPPARPRKAEPVSCATTAAPNAAPSILPSSAILTTPARSENSPASAQKINGVASLITLSISERSGQIRWR